MSLTLNAAEARKADSYSSKITETGKYVGVITRAEKLKSPKGTVGLGISFKAENGATANYLDIYTAKADGEELWGAKLVQAILCCTRTKSADDGQITVDKWDREVNEMTKATVPGYPALMGKRIGLLLQRTLETNQNNGADVDKVNLVAVFEADTGLTSTEILEGKTKAETTDQRLKALAPVWDRRKKKAEHSPAPLVNGGKSSDFDDDIPF